MLKNPSEVKNKIESLKDFFQIKGAECPVYQAIRVKSPIPNDSEGALTRWHGQHNFLGNLVEFVGKEILIQSHRSQGESSLPCPSLFLNVSPVKNVQAAWIANPAPKDQGCKLST